MPRGDSPENDPLEGIRWEKKIAGKGASWLSRLWPWVALIGGPAANSLIAPAVAKESSVIGIFFATLAFSFGVAAFCFIVMTEAFGDMGPYQYAMVAAVCLVGGSVLAYLIGEGSYTSPVLYGKFGSTPAGSLLPFLDAAVSTFGPLGAVLGGWSGFLAGRWGALSAKAHDGA